MHAKTEAVEILFQSTLPAGEATSSSLDAVSFFTHFNPRFPRGKRPKEVVALKVKLDISIHASRGGSDGRGRPSIIHPIRFQSTLPAGEATTVVEW